MSKALQEKINELFDKTKDLMSFEEIKPYCEEFNEWANQAYNRETLGTQLSRYGFFKKFKTLKLEQGKNADLAPKHDKEGNVEGYTLKHYVLLLCGLTKEQWEKRNETSRVTDRITSVDEQGNIGQEVEPDTYLDVTGKLLQSDNPHELAVGLIAATGRRPHEILARGKFTAIEGEEYKVTFEGQGKKREGDSPVITISTLYPANYLIKCLSKLRQDAVCKSLLAEVKREFPNDLQLQNRSIENKRGNSLRRVVQEFFGGRDDKEPILNFRLDQDQNDCKALRAAYAALVTERDCSGSLGGKVYYYALMLGHITSSQKVSDRELMKLTTTVGYADYYVKKPVQFPQAPVKQAKAEKILQVRVTQQDFNHVKDLQAKWNLPNQQSVVTQLVKKSDELEVLQKQLMDAQAQLQQATEQVNQLNKQLQEQQQMNTQGIDKDLFKPLMAELKAELLAELLAEIKGQQPQTTAAPSSTLTTSTTPTTRKIKEVEQIDYEFLNNDELKKLRGDGAVDEKIRRAFVSITNYNDAQPSNDTRWAITNQSLRQISGCNGQKVADWMNRYQTSLNDHNAKYGLGQYHNKVHKGLDITKVVK